MPQKTPGVGAEPQQQYCQRLKMMVIDREKNNKTTIIWRILIWKIYGEIKWNTTPTFIADGSVVPVSELTHTEALALMATAEWSEPIPVE